MNVKVQELYEPRPCLESKVCGCATKLANSREIFYEKNFRGSILRKFLNPGCLTLHEQAKTLLRTNWQMQCRQAWRSFRRTRLIHSSFTYSGGRLHGGVPLNIDKDLTKWASKLLENNYGSWLYLHLPANVNGLRGYVSFGSYARGRTFLIRYKKYLAAWQRRILCKNTACYIDFNFYAYSFSTSRG